MSATQTNAIVDQLLTQASSAYIPEGYISEALLPSVDVVETTGKLAKYGSNHLRIETTLASGKGKFRRAEPIVRSQSTYDVESHGLEGLVSDRDYRNAQKPYDAERDETIGLSTLVWLSKEKALADALGSTSILTQNTTLSGTSQFNDYANSDPLDDFKTARIAVKNGCGQKANTAVMSWEVAEALAYHPGILDALGFTKNRAGQLSEAELAKAMGVKRLLIADVDYDSADEGQSQSLAPVWGKNVIFCVAPEAARPYQVSLGYQVRLKGIKPRQVTKWAVNNPPRSKSILVEDHYDMFLSNVNAAYLIKDAIA